MSGGFGIDVGTANTVVCHRTRGVLLDEPSVMVIRTSEARTRRVRPLLVGREARDLMGRCPVGLSAVRPLHDGVIVDLEAARAFMSALLAKAALPAWQRIGARAVVGVPAGATALERRALLEVADEAGMRKAVLIPEPIAGAVGCGLDPLEPRAHMVLDIGGGTSEITAFCYGGVLSHRSSRIAGDEMTLTLYRHLRAEHQLLVGELTAEALKCAVDAEEGLSTVVQGIDLATGRPRLKTVESAEVLEALQPTADAIIAALAGVLDDLPPQAADDILTEGVVVFGGASLLRGFDKLIESALGFPVRMAERPLTCVAEGAARCLADPDVVRAYEDTFIEAG
ncbi:rod shape-determining protein [Nocardioides sp. STR2]|uniref:Cell shape-determining protein MreB n=1 Tax=Nocardioides pini TaxID=2975053 RepID=A0ABT4C9R4_9ACTN|nr:rod shape-determining protein [Nocardioides pini]MCY4725704.1 rod shape-determining protein [Nocardioides pini]